MDTTAERVTRVLVDTLDLSVDPGQLAGTTSLYSPVIQLDSLNLLHLGVALRAEFGPVIDEEDVLEADLEDVASLIRLVASKVAP